MLVFLILTPRKSFVVSFENTFGGTGIILGRCVGLFTANWKLQNWNKRVNEIHTKKVDMYFSMDTHTLSPCWASTSLSSVYKIPWYFTIICRGPVHNIILAFSQSIVFLSHTFFTVNFNFLFSEYVLYRYSFSALSRLPHFYTEYNSIKTTLIL